MIKLMATCMLGFSMMGCLLAQTPVEKALQTFSATIGPIGFNSPEYNFFAVKTGVKKLETPAGFYRDEALETVGQNGLESITYYFDTDENKPLYQMIIAFSDKSLRDAFADKLLGPPNYPGKPDYWVAGGKNTFITVAWTQDNNLVIAANLAGTEWFGNELFKLPPGFERYKTLPGISTWPEPEIAQFVSTLENQIEAAAVDFVSIRATTADADGQYTCLSPLQGATTSKVNQLETGKWVVTNTMVSGADAENAMIWKLDAENWLGNLDSKTIKLSRTKSQKAFGTTMDVWNVTEISGKQVKVQIGVMNRNPGAEKQWNVDFLVMKQ